MTSRLKYILTFCITFLTWSFMHAQVVFQDDFESVKSGWVFIDQDMDGYNWEYTTKASNSGTFSLASYSWDGTALLPNNYAISPMIDLSGVTPPITLSYYHVAPDANFDIENYSLYVADSQTVSNVESKTAILNQNMDGINNFTKVTLDLSAYAGDTVYLAWKHHSSANNWYFAIDDILVYGDIQFDLELDAWTVDNPYVFGQTPQFLAKPVSYSVIVKNNGNATLNKFFTQTYGFKNNVDTAITLLPIGIKDTFSALLDIQSFVIDSTYIIDSILVDIDSVDEITSNNKQNFQHPVLHVSEDYYAIIDSQKLLSPPLEVLISGGDTSKLYYNPLDSTNTYVADQMIERSILTSDSLTGSNQNMVYYGALYDFKVNTQIKSIQAVISPTRSGQPYWVEVFRYDDWINDFGGNREPIFTSKKDTIASYLTDIYAHPITMNFELSELVVDSGKYIFCFVEKQNTTDSAIGMLGIQASNFNKDIQETHSFLALKNSGKMYDLDLDQSFFSGSEPIDIAWPISLTVGEGCDEYVQIDASSSVICNGSAVSLSSSNTATNSYQWHNENGEITGEISRSYVVSDSGHYELHMTDSTGCNSKAKVQILKIDINTSISSIKDSLFADMKDASYQWLDCENGNAPMLNDTNRFFTSSDSGLLAVEISKIGCIDTSLCFEFVGIHEQELISLNLYPNPFSDFTILELSTKASQQHSKYQIQLINAEGRLVRHFQTTRSRVKILKGDLKPGIYLLKVFSETNTGYSSVKLMVEQ